MEEEYVMIDFDEVSRHIEIPSDAPYTLSVSSNPYSLVKLFALVLFWLLFIISQGLDTLNPVLTIDGKIKLVSFL